MEMKCTESQMDLITCLPHSYTRTRPESFITREEALCVLGPECDLVKPKRWLKTNENGNTLFSLGP